MTTHSTLTRPEWCAAGFELSDAEISERGRAVARGAADWLALAAAPTFALMALLTGVLGGSPDMLCAEMQGTSSLSGMVPMYLLMSAFHSAPWLRLISSRDSAAGRS